jgi:hypothetical protein
LGFTRDQATFGVFRSFSDEAGRETHMTEASEAIRAKASELFGVAPTVDDVDIVSAKLPS